MKDKQVHRRKFLQQAAAVGAALPLVPETLMAAQKTPVDGENANGGRLVLWYDKPASQWVEASPIGNGRLGAMVFGGVPSERLQLTESVIRSVKGTECKVRYGDQILTLQLKRGASRTLIAADYVD